MMYIAIVAGVGVIGLGLLSWWLQTHKEDTIFDYQKALLFHRGRFTRVLDAGTYRLSRRHDTVITIDLRPVLYTLPGQEILTSDKISIKITAGGTYSVIDPQSAFTSGISYAATLYADAQTVLRDIVQVHDLEALLGDRTEINAALHAALSAKAAAIGLDVKDFTIRDIMLPAGLKKAFGGLLEAQKEAQVALEKARGEQAVLRSLANSSRLYAEHPTLLSARLIQALDTGAHTLVFNAEAGVDKMPMVQPKRPR
jgi:regulator of protease activity HflC (stomatin/prohibitin superfamily)